MLMVNCPSCFIALLLSYLCSAPSSLKEEGACHQELAQGCSGSSLAWLVDHDVDKPTASHSEHSDH